MTLSSAIGIASGGLTATARMAQTVSNNLSNSQTEGYGRREVTLLSGQLGGVRVGGIVRQGGDGIILDRWSADADVGRRQAGATVLAAVEQSFGPVGDANGVAGRLAAFEQALISAGSEPSSDVRLRAVQTRASDVIETIRRDADTLKAQREAADRAIAQDIEVLNRSLAQVEELNNTINRMRNSGQDPSPILDSRQLVIDKIASITSIRVIDRGNDQVALYTTSGANLIDGTPMEFGFDQAATIMPAMTLASGALSGVTLDGVPVDANNGYGRLRGGSLEASFILRDQTLPGLQTTLDTIAADLVSRYQDPAVDPTLVAGDPGLFTDGGAALDPLDITGLSFRLELNASVDPAQGGSATQLRDGVNAAAAGPIGSSAQLDRYLEALRSTSSLTPGGAARTLAGHAADLMSDVADQRLYAEENLSFVVARQAALKTAELANGVDTDQELQNLLRIEQAYAANARVITAVDTMLQRLMEI